MTGQPLPRFIRWLLARAVPAEWRDSIEGDLEEERTRRLARKQFAGPLWVTAAAAAVAIAMAVGRRRAVRGEARCAVRRNTLDGLAADLRQAMRGLAGHRGFAATAVLTLALGIGANAAVFTAAWHLLLKPLPWPEPDRLVQIWNTVRRTGDINVLAPANYLDIARESRTLDAAAAYTYFDFPLNLTGAGDPIEARIRAVTGDYFRVFATPALAGRTLTPLDVSTNARVIVISSGLWKRHFGRAADVLTRRLSLDGTSYDVIGVMPPGFDPGARPMDGWVPYHFTAELASQRLGYFLGAVGRLRPGRTVADATAEIGGIALRASASHPSSNQNIGATVRGLRDELTGSLRSGLLLLVACAALVLLIACSNLTSLHLARAGGMGREIAIRMALGATRGQVMRLLLIEAGLVALAAGVAGLVAGSWTVRGIARTAPPTMLVAGPWVLDPVVVAVTLAVSVISGLVVALVASIRATDARSAASLRSRGAADRPGGRLRTLLVTSQVAMATTLMVTALVLLVSFARVLRVDLGFSPAGVVVADVRLPSSLYPTVALRAQFFDTVLERIAAEPGVLHTCATNTVPLEQAGSMTYVPDGTETLVSALPVTVTPGCFSTLGIQLRHGRLFMPREAEPVAIVSESYARRAWPRQAATGQSIRVGLPDGDRLTVIGVVSDSRRVSVERESFGQVYQLASQSTYFSPSRVLVRTAGRVDRTAAAIARAVRETDPLQPAGNMRLLDDIVSSSLGSRRFTLLLLGGFAALALLLASIGVYGLLAELVAGRRAEIGVRMVLGARPMAIVQLVASGALGAVGLGLALGLLGAWLGSRALASIVFGVSATDPTLYAAAAALLFALACAAAVIPLTRAIRLDPIATIRGE